MSGIDTVEFRGHSFIVRRGIKLKKYLFDPTKVKEQLAKFSLSDK